MLENVWHITRINTNQPSDLGTLLQTHKKKLEKDVQQASYLNVRAALAHHTQKRGNTANVHQPMTT